MYKIAINHMALTGKLPTGDPRWAAFNDGFQNKTLETLDIANSIYAGHAYAGWHNGRRKNENFICAQHIGVDLETHDERSTIGHLLDIDFVRIYGGLIHTTPSHTITDPRCRLIFFLDQPITNAVAYKSAVDFVYSLFPGSDPSCVDSARFFYGAKDCTIEWIDHTLPVEHLRNYYSRKKQQDAPQQQTRPRIEPIPRTVTQTQAPKEQDVQEALRRIDPWAIDYKDWVRVLMALHHELGDAGLPLAEQWAQGKDDEVRKKWKSFKVNGNGSGAVTLGTVINMAKLH